MNCDKLRQIIITDIGNSDFFYKKLLDDKLADETNKSGLKSECIAQKQLSTDLIDRFLNANAIACAKSLSQKEQFGSRNKTGA